MNFFKRFIGHTKTVIQHRREVRKLCFKCGLYWQGLTHDLSKFSPTEFFNGVKYFTGTKSPHMGERAEYGYSKAWLHHKGRNKHHAEYWQDINSKGVHAPIDMPTKYFVEMMCDRVAACKIYLKDKYTQKSAWEYYKTHRDENQFSHYTAVQLENYLYFMTFEGEEKTFEVLRELVEYEKEKAK